MNILKDSIMSAKHIDAMRNAVKGPSQQLKFSVYKTQRPLRLLKESSSVFAAKSQIKSGFAACAQMDRWLSENKNLFSPVLKNPQVPKPLDSISLRDPSIDTNVKLDKVAELLENMVSVLNEQSEHQKKVEAWHETDLSRYILQSKNSKSESRKSWLNIVLVAATLAVTIYAALH